MNPEKSRLEKKAADCLSIRSSKKKAYPVEQDRPSSLLPEKTFRHQTNVFTPIRINPILTAAEVAMHKTACSLLTLNFVSFLPG
jgi:hypothetical protein